MNQLPASRLPGFSIRFANEDDCPVILELIRLLAVYEKMEDQVTATVEKLRESLFAKKDAEVLIGEENGRPVGFALFFGNYSTFLGQANVFLEDLYVREDCRGRGYGKALLAALASIAVRRGAKRLDWQCLDWNKPSIDFYRGIGAVSLDQWLVFRLKGEALERLAEE